MLNNDKKQSNFEIKLLVLSLYPFSAVDQVIIENKGQQTMY